MINCNKHSVCLKRIGILGIIGWTIIGLIVLFLTTTDYNPNHSLKIFETAHYFAYIPKILNNNNTYLSQIDDSPFNDKQRRGNLSIAIVSLVTLDSPVYRQMGRYSFLDKIYYASKQQYALFIHTR
jgi:hypothetical protein